MSGSHAMTNWNIRHFTDDGYTGTNFDRPGFRAMMAEIEAGHIGVVIVKDMSRFGRDYLQVGYYTEMFFPERGIRFIAVVNDVDSKKPSSSNDFLPFLNVMNEWYAKDTSRKIKAIFHSRMEKGERCTGSAPYGFMAAKVNGVYQLVIDEEAAKVIRRIFSMAAEGKSTREIADALTADKVLVPSAYDQQTEGRPNYRGAVKEPFHWKGFPDSEISCSTSLNPVVSCVWAIGILLYNSCLSTSIVSESRWPFYHLFANFILHYRKKHGF